MRKGLVFLAPFALLAGLHMACGNAAERSGFVPPGAANEDTGVPNKFDSVDAATDAQGCSASKTEIARVPVVIEFAVDDSGSMDGTGANDKWAAARDALLAAFEDMKNTADPGTFVGVLRWSTNVGSKVAPASLTAATHYDAMVNVINTPKANGGGTNMLIGLNAAYDAVQTFKPPPGFAVDKMNRAVVLVSDGVPLTSEKPLCEALADKKLNELPPNGPILTFSVGIGAFPTTSTASYDPPFMSRIAQKGGTAPVDCSPEAVVPEGLCHFQVTPGGSDSATAKQALIDAINKIRVLSVSCEFAFTTNPNTDLNNVKVEITDKDGNKIDVPKDGENGWSFDNPDDPTKVILHGESCAASSGTVSGRVDVVIGCKAAN